MIAQFKEPFIAWLTLIAGASILPRLGIPLLYDNRGLITAVLLLYIPIFITLKNKEQINYLDSGLPHFLKSLLWFLIAAIIIMSLFVLGHHLYQTVFLHHTLKFTPPKYGLGQILGEIVVVAFPEEFFFRGYFLNRLNGFFGKRWKFLGAQFGPALFIVSFIFAISHSFITLAWWHIFIFFPACVFGWLKEKTGSITAPALFHATCNLTIYWLSGMY